MSHALFIIILVILALEIRGFIIAFKRWGAASTVLYMLFLPFISWVHILLLGLFSSHKKYLKDKRKEEIALEIELSQIN